MLKNIIKKCLTRYQRRQAQAQEEKRKAQYKQDLKLFLQGQGNGF